MSLPVKRSNLFYLTLLRASIFWIPLFCYLMFLVNSSMFFKYLFIMYHQSYLIYTGLIFFTILWSIASSMTLQLNSERITTYLNQQQRLKAWTFFILSFVFEVIVVGYCLISQKILNISPIISLLILASLAIYKLNSTKKKWLFQ
jgi:hypothetical protein